MGKYINFIFGLLIICMITTIINCEGMNYKHELPLMLKKLKMYKSSNGNRLPLPILKIYECKGNYVKCKPDIHNIGKIIIEPFSNPDSILFPLNKIKEHDKISHYIIKNALKPKTVAVFADSFSFYGEIYKIYEAFNKIGFNNLSIVVNGTNNTEDIFDNEDDNYGFIIKIKSNESKDIFYEDKFPDDKCSCGYHGLRPFKTKNIISISFYEDSCSTINSNNKIIDGHIRCLAECVSMGCSRDVNSDRLKAFKYIEEKTNWLINVKGFSREKLYIRGNYFTHIWKIIRIIEIAYNLGIDEVLLTEPKNNIN